MILLPLIVNIQYGTTVPGPLSADMMSSLHQLQLKWSAQENSGFQAVFKFHPDFSSYMLATNKIDTYNRMIFILLKNGMPITLMDGIVTSVEFNPGQLNEEGSFIVKGEGPEVGLDLDSIPENYPNQSASTVVKNILGTAATVYTDLSLAYSLTPKVTTPSADKTPDTNLFNYYRNSSRLQFLRYLGDMFGYIFKIIPGSVPGTNTAFWGPMEDMATSTLDTALTVGPVFMRNVEKITFGYEPMKGFGTNTTAMMTDGSDNTDIDVESSSVESLGSMSFTKTIKRVKNIKHQGKEQTEVQALAEGLANASSRDVLTAKGELNVMTFDDVLAPPGKVKLRGAGDRFDGEYYLMEVTHDITPHSYKQEFTIARDSQGSTLSSV